MTTTTPATETTDHCDECGGPVDRDGSRDCGHDDADVVTILTTETTTTPATETPTRHCDYCATGTFRTPARINIEGETFTAHCCRDRRCRADAETDIRMTLQADACHYDAFGY